MKHYYREKETWLVVFASTIFTTLILFIFNQFTLLSLGLILGANLILFTGYLYRQHLKEQQLILYLQHLNRGDYQYFIESYTEGNYAILYSELFKMSTTMSSISKEMSDQRDFLLKSLEDIAHQLKTPITSLLLLNELDTRHTPEIKMQREQLNRLNRLVQLLLKLVVIDANLIEINPKETALQDVIHSVIDLIEVENTQKHTITVHGKHTSLQTDPELLVEILFNILHNKLRYAQSHINIYIETQGTKIRIRINDDGPALSKRDRENVFKRFYSGTGSRSDSIGIGLSLSYELTQRLNGRLYIQHDNEFVLLFELCQK